MLRTQRQKQSTLNVYTPVTRKTVEMKKDHTVKYDQRKKKETRTGIFQDPTKEVCPHKQEEVFQEGGKASARIQKHQQACHVHTDTRY